MYDKSFAIENNYPIDYVVEFHPETGSVKPYEVYYVYQNSMRIRGSFKTEKAAKKAINELVNFSLKYGHWKLL